MGFVRTSIAFLFLVSQCLIVATPGIESRQAAVNRAIEQTKRRQSAPPATQQNTRASARNTAGGRSETLDVERLNSLLRTLDKTWILPRVGAKEPVGSNFQYKKTCASIYKARHGACQQLGFGTMCFNYCHERGEKLVFKCQDTSEASYCRQSATFDIFIAKYRKDAYKAKAYVHQMISRCFATAVCNTQTGILNSTLIEEDIQPETTTKVSRLRITKPAGGFQLPGKSGRNKPKEEEAPLIGRPVKQRKYKPTTPITVPELPFEEVEEEPVEEIAQVVETVATTRLPARRTTTQKANIWDKFTVSAKGKATPKYIPFWQKLLTTPPPTQTRFEESSEVANEEEPQNVTEPESPVEEVEKTTRIAVPKVETERPTTTAVVEAKIVDSTTEEEIEEETTQKSTTTTRAPKRATTRQKHTFKPLPVTPQGPDLAFMKPGDPNSAEQLPGFWNKFQPGRWYQSIHYLTNTGR